MDLSNVSKMTADELKAAEKAIEAEKQKRISDRVQEVYASLADLVDSEPKVVEAVIAMLNADLRCEPGSERGKRLLKKQALECLDTIPATQNRHQSHITGRAGLEYAKQAALALIDVS